MFSRGELTESNLRLRDTESIESKVGNNYDEQSPSPPRSVKSYKSSGTQNTSASAMLDVKNGRKRAEADLQLLANRIALLRAEEQKAVTKMVETQSRAQEIIQIKKRNEDMVKEKVANYTGKEQQTKAMRDKINNDREERQKNIAYGRKVLRDSKHVEAIETKVEAKKIEEARIMERLAVEEEKKARAMEEKRRRDAAKRLREKELAEKQQLAQLQYTKKIAEEARRTAEAEEMIKQLEREERELIERLKSTQDKQREAYELLQKSLEV